MEFPYGEWVIFLLTLITWAQRHPGRRFYLSLSLAWLVGRIIDFMVLGGVTWNLNYARLAVMLVFWWWAWRKAEECLSAFLLTLLSQVLLDLYLVNEPGVLVYDKWIFAGLGFLIAWLVAGSYWGMAAAVAGSIFLNQGLIIFFYGGIISHVNLPDTFLWNFAVLTLTFSGLIRLLRQEIKVGVLNWKLLFESSWCVVRNLWFKNLTYVKSVFSNQNSEANSDVRGQRSEANSDVRGQKSEVKSDVGGQKSEVGVEAKSAVRGQKLEVGAEGESNVGDEKSEVITEVVS